MAARERAASVPLPGPLGDAFAACAASGLLRTGESANRRSGDIAASPSRPLADSLPSPSHLRPVSLRDFIFLRAWQHPLYDELCGAEARSWTQNELDQVAALFREQKSEVREQKSEVREQTGAAGPLTSDLRSLTSALISDFRALFHQAFSTIVSFVPANRDGSITISSGPEDGVGWWLSLYRFLIMDCHFAPDAALDYPLCQAWALRAAHHDRNPLLEMDGDGYIAQEEQRLKAKG